MLGGSFAMEALGLVQDRLDEVRWMRKVEQFVDRMHRDVRKQGVMEGQLTLEIPEC